MAEKKEIIFRIVLVLFSWLILSAVGMLPSIMRFPGTDILLGDFLDKIYLELYECPMITYEEWFCDNNANLSQGTTGYSKGKKLYLQYENAIHTFSFDQNNYAVLMDDVEESIIFDGKYYFEFRDREICMTHAEGTTTIKYDWKSPFVRKDGTINYNALYMLLKKQSTQEMSAKQLSSLIGFTSENVIVGWNGRKAVFAEREDGQVRLYVQAEAGPGNLKEMVTIETADDVLFMNNTVYYLNSNRSIIYRIDINSEDHISEKVLNVKDGDQIEFLNISHSDNGDYLAFLSDGKLCMYGLNSESEASAVLDNADKVAAIYCCEEYCYVHYLDCLSMDFYTFEK